jgi:hypothetical protein
VEGGGGRGRGGKRKNGGRGRVRYIQVMFCQILKFQKKMDKKDGDDELLTPAHTFQSLKMNEIMYPFLECQIPCLIPSSRRPIIHHFLFVEIREWVK